jgi:4-amino-4-deoxy-L-arabinose transferase-like glycosyltransferase
MPLIIIGLIFALCTYLYGLDSLHILRNGDELVYMQITRVTSMTNQWLPLQSDMTDMRNTKPPLLFWQGLLSTDWGSHWSLVALRWPSVLWTFATALLCGLLGWRLSGRDEFKGALAALFYLAFFTTYRYGRPYLTNPPETFWMFACFFTMMWWKPRSFDSRFVFPTILGVLAGMALLTKSFAQLLPIGFGLACWHIHMRGWRLGAFMRESLPGILWTALLSLGMFSLWFVLDPDPAEIWREFVVGENIGKMGSGVGSWFKGLLWKGDTVWSLAGSWFSNAGLLAFPLFGVMAAYWKHRRTLLDGERLLWIWVFAIFIVFCIPSERSGRYLLEGMPALAVLMAMRWQQVGCFCPSDGFPCYWRGRWGGAPSRGGTGRWFLRPPRLRRRPLRGPGGLPCAPHPQPCRFFCRLPAFCRCSMRRWAPSTLASPRPPPTESYGCRRIFDRSPNSTASCSLTRWFTAIQPPPRCPTHPSLGPMILW